MIQPGSENGQLQAYPYFDQRFHNGTTHRLMPIVAEAISRISGPIVELGGPTERGFRLLRQSRVLPRSPLITNVCPRPGTAWVLDAMKLDLPDRTVSMFLASHLSDSAVMNYPDQPQDDVSAKAEAEYACLAAHPSYTPQYNLRLGAFKEMGRVIQPSGFVLWEALGTADLAAAERLGWTILQAEAERPDMFDCVLLAA